MRTNRVGGAIALLGLLLAGCDDHLFPAIGSSEAIESDGWCAMQEVVASSCLECHSAAVHLEDLDLETTPHATLLAFVVPGDPGASELMHKLDGTQSVGNPMPPSGLLPEEVRDKVRAWIADGADDHCDAAPPTPSGGSPHPEGWVLPENHGIGAKFQQLQCQTCHGEDLEGDLGPACSACHTGGSKWKQDCTYCHGTPGGNDGAPPQDIDDNTDLASSPFAAHRAHLNPGDHATIRCETCHTVPESVFSVGHLFVGDSTPGVSEVTFTGLAAGGAWDGQACTVACHGDGRSTGTVDHQAGERDCSSCHASLQGPANTFDHLSGEHEEHLDEHVVCGDCHATTVSGASTIIGPQQHVDGQVQVALPAGMNRSNGRCTGTCHGENHQSQSW